MRRLLPIVVTCALGAVAACDSGQRPSTPAPTSIFTSTPGSAGSNASATSSAANTSAPPVTLPSATSAPWRQIQAQAAGLAPNVAIAAGHVGSDGTLHLDARLGPTDARPLASVVKLYVLLAVVTQIRTGSLQWATPLTLQAVDKAGGSGSLAGRAVGSRLTVQEAATLMVHDSDNTATDLLMRTVGQQALQKAVAASGHSAPSRFVPFPTIRQDLWLEWGTSPAARSARRQWPSASASRRTELVRAADSPAEANPALVQAPRWQQGFGYFAAATEIALALTQLHRASKEPGMTPLRSVLANPGIDISKPGSWRWVAYKSGTVAGARNGAWYAETAGDDQVLVILASSPGSVSDTGFSALASNAAGVLSGS